MKTARKRGAPVEGGHRLVGGANLQLHVVRAVAAALLLAVGREAVDVVPAVRAAKDVVDRLALEVRALDVLSGGKNAWAGWRAGSARRRVPEPWSWQMDGKSLRCR